MMSVASWLHCRGISASFISKTTEPSGLEMRLVRFSYSTVEKTSWPALVNRRVIFMMRFLPCYVSNIILTSLHNGTMLYPRATCPSRVRRLVELFNECGGVG